MSCCLPHAVVVAVVVATFLLCPCLSERHGVPRALNHKKRRSNSKKKSIYVYNMKYVISRTTSRRTFGCPFYFYINLN